MDDDSCEYDVLDRIACLLPGEEPSVVDTESCIALARAGIAAVDELLAKTGSDVSASTVTADPDGALLAALPSGVPRMGWKAAPPSLPLTHTTLAAGLSGTAVAKALASALSAQFLSKVGDASASMSMSAFAASASLCVALPLNRIKMPRSADGVAQSLLGRIGALFSPSSPNVVETVSDAANAALATSRKEALGAEQAFVLGDRVHYSPQWEALCASLALALLKHEPALGAAAARHVAAAALVVSRRARCAGIALAAVSRIVNIPGVATALLDAALSPAISFSCLTTQRAAYGTADTAAGATVLTSSYGPCVRVQTPLVILLKAVGDTAPSTANGTNADGGIVGRFLVVVTHEVSFSASLSDRAAGLTFGALCEANEGGARVLNGRIDVAWAPGDDLTSVRNVFLLFDPLQLSVMLRTPLSSAVFNEAGGHRNAAAEGGAGAGAGAGAVAPPPWSDSIHARAAVITAGAARALVTTIAARKVVRAGKGSSATLPQPRPEVFFHKGGAIARVALSPDADDVDALLRGLDAQTGQAFADSAWRALCAPPTRANAYADDGSSILNNGSRPAPPALPISHTQVFAWGAGGSGQLGVGDTPATLPIPAPLAFAGELGMWRVAAVACGWHHTVLLTDMGTVYTWGNGGDGQLGVGDLTSAPIPRLVDFFGLTHPLTAVAIAAGSDSGGSHTLVIARGNLTDEVGEGTPAPMLLDDRATGRFSAALEGRVFSWGVDPAVGNSGFEPVLSPKLVRSDVLSVHVCEMYDAVHGGVVAVAAGGGFSLALTRSGALYSWGRHANGRLGLGEAPLADRAPGASTVRSRMTAAAAAPTRLRSQAFPMRVTKGLAISNELLVESPTTNRKPSPPPPSSVVDPAAASKVVQKLRIAGTAVDCAPLEGGQPTLPLRSIAAGEAHSLAIDVFGLIWSWGHGGGGSLGHGSTRDFLVPRRVACAGPDGRPVRFASVAAGSAHSLAISTDNSLYSWGGAGRGLMLGHADGLLRERVPTGTTMEPLHSESLATEMPSALLSRMRARRKAESLRDERGGMTGVDDDDGAAEAGVPQAGDGSDDDEPDAGDFGAANSSLPTEIGSLLLRESKWRRPWLRPRIVHVLDGSSPSKRVTAAGGGWAHSWALTTAGELYAWGDNTAGQLGVPPSLSTISDCLPRIVGAAAGSASSVAAFQETVGGDMTDGGEAMLATFKAASSILRISSEAIVCAAAGGWHMMAVSGGSYEGLMLRQAWPMAPFVSASLSSASMGGGSSVASAASGSNVPSQGAKWMLPEIFSTPGAIAIRGYDVRLRTSDGRELSAHRAVLAARSTTLAVRLVAEALVIPSRARRVPPLLLLPDLTASVASALLEWIYTDRLSVPLSPTGGFTRLVAAAANAYGIPRLYALCSILLESPVVYWTRQVGSGVEDENEDGDGDGNRNGEIKANTALSLSLTDVSQLIMPAEAAAAQQNSAFELAAPEDSLSSQMMRLLVAETPMWCDVVITAGGWRFAAHAVVVCSACEYFRSVLARSLQVNGEGEGEGFDADDDAAMIEIALPDSAATTIRLLYFMYSGTLPPLPASADDANLYGILPGTVFPAQVEASVKAQGEAVPDPQPRRGLWVFDGLAQPGDETEGGSAESEPEPKPEPETATTPATTLEIPPSSSPIIEEEEGGKSDSAALPGSAIAGISGLCPGVDSSWTPEYQLLCDIAAADRYGIASLSTLAASLLQVTPHNAAQVLELSDLLPSIPRIREAALQAASRDLNACLSSAAFATLRMRSPQLMDLILKRVSEDHDSAFFRGLAAELAKPITPADEKRKADIEAERLASEGVSKTLGRFTWEPVVALVVVAGFFAVIAEYNSSTGWYIPVLNIGMVIAMALFLFTGMVKI